MWYSIYINLSFIFVFNVILYLYHQSQLNVILFLVKHFYHFNVAHEFRGPSSYSLFFSQWCVLLTISFHGTISCLEVGHQLCCSHDLPLYYVLYGARRIYLHIVIYKLWNVLIILYIHLCIWEAVNISIWSSFLLGV